MGFPLKIPLFEQFHTFSGRFHTFCLHLRIFDLVHKECLIKAIGGVQGVKNICFSAKTYFLENLSGFRNFFTELKNNTVARFCGHFSAARYA